MKDNDQLIELTSTISDAAVSEIDNMLRKLVDLRENVEKGETIFADELPDSGSLNFLLGQYVSMRTATMWNATETQYQPRVFERTAE